MWLNALVFSAEVPAPAFFKKRFKRWALIDLFIATFAFLEAFGIYGTDTRTVDKASDAVVGAAPSGKQSFKTTELDTSSSTRVAQRSNDDDSSHFEPIWLRCARDTPLPSGVGFLDARHCAKLEPEPGMLVAKVGGPAYRIGMGGGAASSRIQTSGNVALDFDAVQRGDAQMLNRMNRVVRACVERGNANPIISIHDQGCGGNGNVLKEIVETCVEINQ